MLISRLGTMYLLLKDLVIKTNSLTSKCLLKLISLLANLVLRANSPVTDLGLRFIKLLSNLNSTE